jgi:hypothetical protein
MGEALRVKACGPLDESKRLGRLRQKAKRGSLDAPGKLGHEETSDH